MPGSSEETSNPIGGPSFNSPTKGPLFKLFPPSHGRSTLSYKSLYPSGIDLPPKGTESAPETVRHGQGQDQIFPTDVQQEYAKDDGSKEVRHDNYQDQSVRKRYQQEFDHSHHEHGYNQHSYGRSMSQDGHNQHQHGQSLHKPGQNQRQYDQNQYQKSPSQQLQHDQNQQQHGHGQHQHGISQHQHGNDKHQHVLDQHQHEQLQHQHSQFQHLYGHSQHKHDQDRHQHDKFQFQHSRNQQDQDQNNWDQFQHGQNPYENGQKGHEGDLDPRHQVLYQLPDQPNQRPSQPGFYPNQSLQLNLDNEVDSWIDKLDINRPTRHIGKPEFGGIGPNVTMAWLVQQNLPQPELPKFDGSALRWVTFITKFREIVHDQEYLNDTQRHFYLFQQLIGQAERAVRGFPSNTRGYVLSLQRLKFYFGQKSKIAQATLRIVTKGTAVENDDIASLEEFYYQISDCLVTMQMLRYESDLRSTETLRQAVARLPPKMTPRWAEHSLRIRTKAEEPTLIHFAEWLQERILAMTDPSLPE